MGGGGDLLVNHKLWLGCVAENWFGWENGGSENWFVWPMGDQRTGLFDQWGTTELVWLRKWGIRELVCLTNGGSENWFVWPMGDQRTGLFDQWGTRELFCLTNGGGLTNLHAVWVEYTGVFSDWKQHPFSLDNRGTGWGGGVLNSLFDKQIGAYSRFSKWNIRSTTNYSLFTLIWYSIALIIWSNIRFQFVIQSNIWALICYSINPIIGPQILDFL